MRQQRLLSCIPMAALADECLNINKKFGWMRNKVQLKRTYYRYQRKKERITESNKKTDVEKQYNRNVIKKTDVEM